MQYVKVQRQWVYRMRHVLEPHALDRTPDDSLRYQSVMFALIRALDKVSVPHGRSIMRTYRCVRARSYFYAWSFV
jgi:hypothetical protein